MKSSFTFIKKEKNEVTFKMEIEASKFEEAIQKAYVKNKNKYAVDGFRKGKVPRKILEMKFGEDIFYEDAINILFPEEYTDAVEELKLEPIDRPMIDITEIGKGKNLVIEVEVTVEPEVELGDYKGIEAKKVEYNVTDEDVDNELLAMQDRNARLVNVDRGIVEGDSVLMDFKGFVDGEQIEGGTAESQRLLIGSGNFISGFEDQLIGHKAGEEVEVNVIFPEDYSPELSGKAAVFK
ncbi:MAG: trigger factor, partial [Clostridiales bacterium]|nr:trigger factor [Clostridiales bacterium]